MVKVTKEKIKSILKALEKNEFGQYIVDDLNKFERGIVWRNTKHPCGQTDEALECLDCPYTDCIAPPYISQMGNFYHEGSFVDGIIGAYEPSLPILALGKNGKRSPGGESRRQKMIRATMEP